MEARQVQAFILCRWTAATHCCIVYPRDCFNACSL